MSQQLAVQLYTFRTSPPEGRPALFRALAEAGYQGVEPFGSPESMAEQAPELEAAGLGVCGLHANVERDGLERVAAAAHALGTDTLIIPSLDREGWGDAGNVRRLAARVNEWAQAAAAQGLRVGYHNHFWEMTDVEGGTAYDLFVRELAPEVILELDTYWAAVGGQDVVALLGRLGDRVRLLHLKDGPATDHDTPQSALGTGAMPVAEILAAAPAAEWGIIELDSCATDVLVAVQDSARWLAEKGLLVADR